MVKFGPDPRMKTVYDIHIQYNILKTEQVLFFLLESEKWAPYRDFCYTFYGTGITTLIFGLLTVLFMPGFFWLTRRCENQIQYLFQVRKIAKLPWNIQVKDEKDDHMILESVLTINSRSQIIDQPKTKIGKLKWILGILISNAYFGIQLS